MTISIKLIVVVATFEIEPIDLDDGYGPLKFRIEILKNKEVNEYFPRIYRWEVFRVQPTFPQESGEPNNDLADHEFLIQDTGINCDGIIGDSIEEVLNMVQQRFNETLSLSSSS
jgi:hypothetical protein